MIPRKNDPKASIFVGTLPIGQITYSSLRQEVDGGECSQVVIDITIGNEAVWTHVFDWVREQDRMMQVGGDFPSFRFSVPTTKVAKGKYMTEYVRSLARKLGEFVSLKQSHQ